MAAVRDPSRHGGLRDALSYRDYRWLVTGLAISNIGGWAYNVALYAYVYETTRSASWAAATTVGRFLPSLLLGSYGGLVAERFERRRLLIALDLTSATVMVALGIGAGLDMGPLVAISLAAVASLIGTVYFPATAALTPQIVEERDLAAANSLNSMVDNVSVIIGPALGALVVGVSTVTVTLYLNAGAFVLSAWCSSRLRTRSRPTDVTEGGTAGVLRQVAVGFRAITSSSTAAIVVGASVLASFFYGVDTVLFVVLSEERLGIGANGYGVLMAGLGVGGLVVAPFMNRLAAAPRLATIISLAMVVYTLPTLLLLWVDDPWVAFAIQVVRGAGTLVVDVLAVTALQRSLASDMIARVFGVFMTLVVAAISLGALLTPVLLSLAGLDGTLLVVSLGASLVVAAAFPLTRGVDREMVARLAALSERIEVLARVGIFAAATRPSLERLAAASVEESVGPGTRVIAQGDTADAFFVLLDGAVVVSRRRHDGELERLGELGPGDFFGEIGLLEAIPRTADVDAVGEVRLLRVAGDEFVGALTASAASPAFMERTRQRFGSVRPGEALSARALGPDPRDSEGTPGDAGPDRREPGEATGSGGTDLP